MKYMGSKNRIAKYLLPIILKDRKPGQWYVEPFVGGANMIDKDELKRNLEILKNNRDKTPESDTELKNSYTTCILALELILNAIK